MQIETIFFDLDGTLYNHDSGIWDAISQKMNVYMASKLNIPGPDVSSLREKYFGKYGTTLKGLEIHHNVNSDEFLDYVHDVPVSEYLSENKILKNILEALNQQKWVFTNADQAHANRVLAALGITKHFNGIIDVRTAGMKPKPDITTYHAALKVAGNPTPHTCMMIDDLPKNLKPAKELGFTTVLLGSNNSHNFIDYQIARIEDLKSILLK